MSIRFEWDEQKNITNQRKHRLSFEAAWVFLAPLCLRQQDRYENGEERWQALDTVDGTAVLLVAHTQTDIDGGEVIRIISARRATKSERRQYEQG